MARYAKPVRQTDAELEAVREALPGWCVWRNVNRQTDFEGSRWPLLGVPSIICMHPHPHGKRDEPIIVDQFTCSTDRLITACLDYLAKKERGDDEEEEL